MKTVTIYIGHHWIASCNREWCWATIKGTRNGGRGGPKPQDAIAAACQHLELTPGTAVKFVIESVA